VIAPTRRDRRSFLKTSASGAAGLVVGFHWAGDLAFAQAPQERPAVNPFDAWVHIDADGRIRLVLAKSEMGQGLTTSLPQILAEELCVDWKQITVEQAPTNPAIYEHGTGGSSSVRTSWLPLRQAGAAAREMLIQAAANQWTVSVKTCRAESGAIVHGPRTKRLPYSQLVAAASKLPIPVFKDVPLLNPTEFRLIGKSIPRADIPGKVDGSAVFGLDVRVPGMLFAVVARCPVFGGKVKSFDATKAKAVAGVKHVVEIPAIDAAHSAGGVAVVATSTWAAMQGREALTIEWDEGPHAGESTATLFKQFDELTSKPGVTVSRNDGDAEAALSGAATRIEATYEVPFQNHSPMEVMNATVHVRKDGAEAWLPSQGPEWGLDAIAKLTGLPPEKVVVHTTLMGGGFGRRYHADFIAEATQISQATGVPIKVVFTREDDTQRGFYRPASLHKLSGAVAANGLPAAWRHRMSSVSIDGYWTPPDKAKPANSEIGGAANLPYAIPNLRMEYTPAKSGVPVMWWRSVEFSVNGFVTECFLDELAAAGKVDPLEPCACASSPSRARCACPPTTSRPSTPRGSRPVLELAAAKAGWSKPLPKGRGRGIACHFSFDTYVAEVVEVTMAKDGLKVDRIVAAVDCGRVMNPDGARAQIEGGIIWALTASLKSAITIDKGRVQQSNFDDYEMLRIEEAPAIEVHFVPSEAAPTGLGEPGVPPLASALANAVFAATGRRVRRLPIRPEDLA
jgi:isoquinoline 1-oxidoreductase beta subunit